MQSSLCFWRLGTPLLRNLDRPWHLCSGAVLALPNVWPSNRRFSYTGQNKLRDFRNENPQTTSPQISQLNSKAQTVMGVSGESTAVADEDAISWTALSSIEEGKCQTRSGMRSQPEISPQTFTSIPPQSIITEKDDALPQNTFSSPPAEVKNRVVYKDYRSSAPLLVKATAHRFDAPPPDHVPYSQSKADDLQDFRAKTPGVVLGQILEIGDESERKRYWNSIRQRVSYSSLPIITVHYLLTRSLEMTAWSPREKYIWDKFVHKRALKFLKSRGLTWHDVSNWTYILSGQSPDEMVDRLVSSSPDQPSFILLEILRRDISKVRSLEKLLDYSWDRILSSTRSTRSSITEPKPSIAENIDEFSRPDGSSSPRNDFHLTDARSADFGLEVNTFTILVSRLLYQARRIRPSAMVEIAKMVAPYLHSISASSQDLLDPRLFARLCKMNNYFLSLLSLPSSLTPFQSMAYNWSAQKVLLELAGEFEPPLRLDHSSYRAVVQVLAASKKSARETRSATFRSRSWPPWRVEQDGMDAQRSQDEDFSRVISAIMRSKESGYTQNPKLSIFGGLDPDGSPTIHTRKLLKWRDLKTVTRAGDSHLDPGLWAARVEATRDVHEAWGSFTEFRRKGGKADMSMYLAMFMKLNYESRRLGLKTHNYPTPGDGREVLPVSDDNYSTFYRLRLQPPSFHDLYQEMRADCIRPSGRCLNFLLRHARTFDEGLQYLLDSGLDRDVVSYLIHGDRKSQIPANLATQVSYQILTSFVSLLCRFAPQVVKISSDSDLQIVEHVRTRIEKEDSALRHPYAWRVGVREPTRRIHHSRLRRPLHHSAFLLQSLKPKFRPAWYALFRCLARRDIVISRQLATDPERLCENHGQAWRVTMATLEEFHNCDLELDPEGLRLICQTFAKYAEAAFHKSERHRNTLVETSWIIKAECTKLTSRVKMLSSGSRRLLHHLEGVHIHAYVRAMGLIGDHSAIISLLEWMVQNYKELDAIASQTGNGQRMLRQTFVATRAFCDSTDHEANARAFVEQIESWGGWPEAEEVQRYLDHGEEQEPSTDTISGHEEHEEDDAEARAIESRSGD